GIRDFHVTGVPCALPIYLANLRAPPLRFRRRPPQSNYPPDTVRNPGSGTYVRTSNIQGWYFKDGSTRTSVPASKPPTYPTHVGRSEERRVGKECWTGGQR